MRVLVTISIGRKFRHFAHNSALVLSFGELVCLASGFNVYTSLGADEG